MPESVTQPTPYPDVNAALQLLLSSVQTVLSDEFVGLVVHGSLASGDFDPGRSDVDFLVITANELPDPMLPTLVAMHERITASGLTWTTKLEGPYIPQPALRHYDPAHAYHPALRVDGSFDVDFHASDWIIQRHVIREQGIVMAGPDPHSLIDPIEPDELRRAAQGILGAWWLPQLDDHSNLHNDEYQAYAILTMCRILYTLEHGRVVSKSNAARWAQANLGNQWSGLIERALAWQHGLTLDGLNETLGMIWYALGHSQQFAIPEDKA